MRTVRITHANGVNDWLAGDAGAIRFLTDEQAYEAVEVHALAVYIDDGPGSYAPPAQPIPVVKVEPGLDPDDLLDHIEAVADGDPEASPLAVPKMPWTTHSKATWIDWAVSLGEDPERAAGMTKNELMSRYGERM